MPVFQQRSEYQQHSLNSGVMSTKRDPAAGRCKITDSRKS